MKVKLNRYHFDLSNKDESAKYSALVDELTARGLKCFSVLACQHEGFPPEGYHTIETDFVFDNQYNTDKFRIFDWTEVIYDNRGVKDGYYLTETEELEAFKTQHYVCGYCGHRHNGHDAPINCHKCLGNPYLKPTELHLTVMNPVKGPKRQSTVTIEAYDAAQEKAKADYAVEQKKRLVKEADKCIEDAKGKAEKIIYEAEEKAKIMRQGYSTENLIYYDHTGKWVLGWREPVTQEESEKFRSLDLDIDVEIKMKDGTTC